MNARTFMYPGQKTDSLVVSTSDVRVHEDELSDSERSGIFCNLDHMSYCTCAYGERKGHWVGSSTIVDLPGVGQNASNSDTHNRTAGSTWGEGQFLNDWVFANLCQDQSAMCLG